MGYYSIWPSFICAGILFYIVSTPLFSWVDIPSSNRPGRVATFDGLRGFLAIAVVFHHAAVYHRFLLDGVWTPPPSRFYAFLGPFGVDFFFMITSYLFWSRILNEQNKVDFIQLLVGRVFRIGPLYLAAASLVILISFGETGFTPYVSLIALAKEITRWLSLGFFLGGGVNGYSGASLLLAGVTWTIQWEWYFYISLPFTAFIARSKHFYPVILAVLLVACFSLLHFQVNHPSIHQSAVLIALFLQGMLCASLQYTNRFQALPQWASLVLTLAFLTLAFYFQSASASKSVLFLGLAFYLISKGCSFQGILLSKAARRLGTISYGVYLLQGLVFDVVMRPAPARSLDCFSPYLHWAMILLTLILLSFLAAAAHIYIEIPGITLGRTLGSHLSTRNTSLAFRKGRKLFRVAS